VVNNERHVPKEITAFTKEAFKVSDGAFVVKTTHSGKYYHLRMRVKSEGKYFRTNKSLWKCVCTKQTMYAQAEKRALEQTRTS
jgi:hypothetical protein